MRKTILFALLVILATSGLAFSQAGSGSFRGYVRDESGGILPGTTVTATSPAIIAPKVAVADGSGFYRLPNLPPGTYVITAQLSGFAAFRRENVVLRADANFGVDITMTLSTIEETVTVTAETPMLEVATPGNILNMDGEFQREMPIQARRNWSDFLELTPGVNARPFDDGSGRMVYFGHGTEHFAHVIMLEGMMASAYDDAQVTYVGMGADMIDDVSVKTGGVTADEPLGTGIVMNVVTKSGGNTFSGSAGYAIQSFGMNGNNAQNLGVGSAGTPTTNQVRQFDGAIGGPIVKDKAWFFFSYRNADNAAGISRQAIDVDRLNAFSGVPLGGGLDTGPRGTIPVYEEFPNSATSSQPYFKFTSQINNNNQFSFYFQRDQASNSSDREFNWAPFLNVKTGGNLYGGKMTSVFGTNTTAQFTAAYNDKSSEDPRNLQPIVNDINLEIEVHNAFIVSAGELDGTGRIVAGGTDDVAVRNPSSYLMIRGDITHYKEGWGGSHEFKTGLYLAPRNRRRDFSEYANNVDLGGDGWYFEDHVPVDPLNLSLGTRPFKRQRRDVSFVETRYAKDRDIGIYFQDSWKPNQRLTVNLGLRVDFVERYDALFDFSRMNTTVFGPRAGFSYMLTDDGRNVLRGSYGRVHEAVNGRDNVTSYNGSGGGATTLIESFDLNGDGIFNGPGDPADIISPGAAAGIDPSIDFDPNLTQPYVDEFILGYRTQLPGQLAIDAAWVNRNLKKNYALTDINGMYPTQGQCCNPFIGFGNIDVNRGEILQQTNNTWSNMIYNALEITATKQMQDFQFMAGINRQWQHFGGTWNPSDPANYIEPQKFDSDKALYMPRGNNENDTLSTSTNLSYNPTWRKYSIRLGATWRAPADITIAGSFTSNAGPWSGAIVTQISAASDEVRQYGPQQVQLPNGTSQGNPLATTIRLVGEDRGSGCEATTLPDNGVFCDGQVRAPTVNTLGVKIGKIFSFGQTQQVEVAANIFNLFNNSDHNQFTYSGANRSFSNVYAELRSLQAARGLQLTFVYRF